MSLRLGLDFGTATTCVATVADKVNFIPEVVPLDGVSAFQSSAVFLDAPNGERPIVQSRSDAGRSPLALFEAAETRFESHWRERIRAQSDGIAWQDWLATRNREMAMLLTYFKPELADFPVRRPVRIPVVRWGTYDALAQSDDLRVDFIEREVASPEPDTEDLIAATAAIIRASVERSTKRFNEKLSFLAIGMPSFGHSQDAAEVIRAKERRIAAVALSGIKEKFATEDFRLEFLGEAQAAAFALDVSADGNHAFGIIVDVGAGTTDLALVPYERQASGRFEATAPVITESIRFAGRDLNMAVALALMVNKDFRDATKLLDQLDRRAWQLIMDQEVEKIKRALGPDEAALSMRLAGIAGHVDGCPEHELRMRILSRVPKWDLSSRSPEIRAAVNASCKPEWLPKVVDFLQRTLTFVEGERGGVLAGIELVGGAFRFEPLRNVFQGAVRAAGLSHLDVRFRDQALSTQTAVARGLAYWAAKQ